MDRHVQALQLKKNKKIFHKTKKRTQAKGGQLGPRAEGVQGKQPPGTWTPPDSPVPPPPRPAPPRPGSHPAAAPRPPHLRGQQKLALLGLPQLHHSGDGLDGCGQREKAHMCRPRPAQGHREGQGSRAGEHGRGARPGSFVSPRCHSGGRPGDPPAASSPAPADPAPRSPCPCASPGRKQGRRTWKTPSKRFMAAAARQ